MLVWSSSLNFYSWVFHSFIFDSFVCLPGKILSFFLCTQFIFGSHLATLMPYSLQKFMLVCASYSPWVTWWLSDNVLCIKYIPAFSLVSCMLSQRLWSRFNAVYFRWCYSTNKRNIEGLKLYFVKWCPSSLLQTFASTIKGLSLFSSRAWSQMIPSVTEQTP